MSVEYAKIEILWGVKIKKFIGEGKRWMAKNLKRALINLITCLS